MAREPNCSVQEQTQPEQRNDSASSHCWHKQPAFRGDERTSIEKTPIPHQERSPLNLLDRVRRWRFKQWLRQHRPRQTPRRQDRYLPVRLSAIVGLGCSAIAALLVWKVERGRTEYDFQKRVDELTAAIQQRTNSYLEVPDTLGTFYEAVDRVKPQNFQLLSESFLDRYPAIESLAWVNRVDAGEREVYERTLAAQFRQRLSLEKSEPFPIWEFDDLDLVIPARPRPQYWPVTYIEPLSQYRSRLGYNWLEEDLEQLSPTRPREVAIADVEDETPSKFQALRAVYRPERTPSGFIVVEYALDRLLAEIVDGVDINLEHLNFELVEGVPRLETETVGSEVVRSREVVYDRYRFLTYKAEGEEIATSFRQDGLQGIVCPVFPQCTREISVADREWVLVVRPQPGYRSHSLKVEATLAVGVVLTALVVAYLWMSIQRTILLERAKQALERSKDKLKEQAQWERSIDRLASQVRNSLDIDTILDTVVRELRKLLSVDRCSFCWYWEDDGLARWDVVAESHDPTILSQLGQSYPVRLVGLTEEIARHLTSCRVDRIGEISSEAYQQFLQAMDSASCLTLPIQTQSGALGLVVLVDRASRDWSDRELDSIETVGTQLAIAFNQAELYRQSQQKAEQLARTVEKLQKTQSQLVQTEKMSGLGQLAAGIAHEINNPVNFIYGNLSHVENYANSLLELLQRYGNSYPDPPIVLQDYIEEIDLEFLQYDFPKILTSMKVGTERIQEIVRSMRTFSRIDEADMKAVDIHTGIESTLTILQSRIKATKNRPAISILKFYGNLPERVTCYAGQLNQVFMNVLSNSIDALDSQYNGDMPTIWIETELDLENRVTVRMRDNGPGIPNEQIDRLFEPFFTTKPIGRGTGLGLSIGYQIIVEKHRGDFYCKSQVGRGTEFTIVLPPRCIEMSLKKE
ncbi:MAG: GAF domain-containing protein [Cyanobacteria bacterium SID2]|nr:GAF domain-containing protein [Cyanobacteria bacterium SID2]